MGPNERGGAGLGSLAAWAVWVGHVAFVAFMILAPFGSTASRADRTLLVLHLLVTPLLWLHWWSNNDTCALTALEKRLRGVERDDESFFYALVSPVYRIRDETVRAACWAASVALWAVSLSRASVSDVVAVLTR